jgi:GAF domain-containing protein
LKKLITEQMPFKGDLARDEITRYMMDEFGGTWPAESAFFPVIAEGRVVALLYCDNSSSGEAIGETEGLEIFVDHAGLALEKSLLQRRLQEMESKKGAEEA